MEVLVQQLRGLNPAETFLEEDVMGIHCMSGDNEAIDLSLKPIVSTNVGDDDNPDTSKEEITLDDDVKAPVSLATTISFDTTVPSTNEHVFTELQNKVDSIALNNVEIIKLRRARADKIMNERTQRDRLEMAALLTQLPQLDNIMELHCKVGEGTFSSVYLATLRQDPSRRFAVKHLTPTCHPVRIQRELQCLRDIGGSDNVCGITLCLRNNGCVVFIMPYQPHCKFHDYVLEMDTAETRLYMRNLLTALRRVHKFGIIHRDVKPGNFLYDRINKKFLLVDFGLSQSLDSPSLAGRKNVQGSQQQQSYQHVAVSMAKMEEQNKRKRKNEENSNSRYTPSMERSAKRPALHPQNDNRRNVFTPSKPTTPTFNPKAFLQQFQLLAPPSPKGQLFIQSQNLASYVRVQNSRVQMLAAPLLPHHQDPPKCPCFSKPQLCEVCLRRRKMVAPRAGTPGFRPPEVLLKSMNQTTAVDMWAAGVLLLSILSGCYPFFRSPDDMSALAELMTLLGTKAIRDTAIKLDVMLVLDKERNPLDLQKTCTKLRSNRINRQMKKKSSGEAERKISGVKCPLCGPSLTSLSGDTPCLCPSSHPIINPQFPVEAYDLLNKLLDPNPGTRINAEDALNHPFLLETE